MTGRRPAVRTGSEMAEHGADRGTDVRLDRVFGVSIVVPVHNEAETVAQLVAEVDGVIAREGLQAELVLVDDGSSDGTWQVIRRLRPQTVSLVALALARHCGQSAALACGFDNARGNVVVTMDGDLQNDPQDIPALVQAVKGGVDLVCGWRKDRRDPFLSRRLPSQAANWLLRRITGLEVHDSGCGLKAYRHALVRRVRLYSEMHRFLPLIAHSTGARITELVVQHRPRRHGTSKYGLARTWKVQLDLIALAVHLRFARRPLAWFMPMALPLVIVAVLLLTWDTGERFSLVWVGIGLVVGSLGSFTALFATLSGMLPPGEDDAEPRSPMVHEIATKAEGR